MQYKDKGTVVEYRLCNIPEKLQLLGELGMKPGDTELEYDYSTLAKGISAIGHLIKSVSVKYEGKVLKTWEEVLEIEDMTTMVMEIFGNIINPPKNPKAKK